VKCSTL